jgi:hypothetical protein
LFSKEKEAAANGHPSVLLHFDKGGDRQKKGRGRAKSKMSDLKKFFLTRKIEGRPGEGRRY